MYAIVFTGGKQYKVAEGDVIDVEKLEGEPGTKVKFDVLFVNDGKKVISEEAALAKATVEGEILEQFRGEKALVYKFRRRKRYERTRGHRQYLTKVKITKVAATSRRSSKAAEEAAPEAEVAAE
ncbi:MAG: 50S ribosomal protein L21 [Coriobacteriales bacterium]|nr:50S ribosomal protein L21 [Coriobacteriales bacterium]